MVRIAYNQGPELAYWWFDRYLGFADSQAAPAREAIQRWFDWHRATQLGPYAEALARVRRASGGPVNAGQVCAWFDEFKDKLHTSVREALPALADQALMLTPAQLRHLERRYERINKDLREEYLQDDRAERASANLERSVDRVEMLYGDLQAAQVESLQRSLAASPFDAERWLAERVARQQETLATLRRLQTERPAPAAAQQALWTLVTHAETSPREDYRAYQARLVSFNCALAAQFHNQTSDAQRQFAATKLQGWEGDLRALMTP